MDVRKNKLDSIGENILEAVKSTQNALELFKDKRLNFKKRSDDYDFEDYSDLDIFIPIEKENIDKLQSFDHRSQFKDIKMHLNEIKKNLINKQQVMYDEFVSAFNNLSNQIHATSSVLSFLSYWNEKICDNFELKEYPSKFLKCLELVPQSYKLQIEKDLSVIKRLPGDYDKDEDIMSKIFDFSDHRSNETVKNGKLGSSGCLLSDDSTFNEEIMLKVKDKNTNFNRGNTLKLNISVLDYTVNCGSDGSFPSKPSPYVDRSFGSEDILAESDDEDNNNNVLNTAVHEITSDDEDVILSGTPEFTKSGSLTLDDSDSNYPEIEKCHLPPDDDVTFNLIMDNSLYMSGIHLSQIQDSSTYPLNDSQLDNEEDQGDDQENQENQEDQENQENHLDSTDMSSMDTSKFTFGYSFNNSINVKHRHNDNDD